MSNFVRIYGKYKNEKTMHAFDHSRGVFVKDLIYASYWEIDKIDHVKDLVDYLNKNNPELIFEVRTV